MEHEWVVLCKEEVYYLTEKEYRYLIENEDKRLVVFDDFSINPAFVSSIYRQPIEGLKKRIPCKTCNTNGIIIANGRDETGNFPTCPDCKGAGIDITK